MSKKKTVKREIKIKTCANCRWFEVLEEGFEIGRIEDLRYIRSRCVVLKWEVKEHYLFTVPASGDEIKRPKECEHWAPTE